MHQIYLFIRKQRTDHLDIAFFAGQHQITHIICITKSLPFRSQKFTLAPFLNRCIQYLTSASQNRRKSETLLSTALRNKISRSLFCIYYLERSYENCWKFGLLSLRIILRVTKLLMKSLDYISLLTLPLFKYSKNHYLYISSHRNQDFIADTSSTLQPFYEIIRLARVF